MLILLHLSDQQGIAMWCTAIVYHFMPFCNIFYFSASALHCVLFYCIVLQFISLHCAAFHFIALCYISFHCVAWYSTLLLGNFYHSSSVLYLISLYCVAYQFISIHIKPPCMYCILLNYISNWLLYLNIDQGYYSALLIPINLYIICTLQHYFIYSKYISYYCRTTYCRAVEMFEHADS